MSGPDRTRHRFATLTLVLLATSEALGAAPPTAIATLLGDLETRIVDRADPLFPTPLFALGDRVLFTANESDGPVEMWVTDGTSAGTRMLVDACPGSCGSSILPLAELGGVAIWLAINSLDATKVGLWRSDGTAAGTYRLDRGIDLDDRTHDGGFTVLGDRLFLRASTPDVGTELFVVDAAATRLELAVDVVPGRRHGNPMLMKPLGSKIVFEALDYIGTSSNEWRFGLWESDGTPAGTRRFDRSEFFLDSFTVSGDQVFYRGGESALELRAHRAGGEPVVVLSTTASSFPGSYSTLVPWNGGVLFIGEEPATGQELWFSDGTRAGTHPLTSLVRPDAFAFDAGEPVVALENAVVLALKGTSHTELWSWTPGIATLRRILDGPIHGWTLPFGGRQVLAILPRAAGRTSGPLDLWTTDGTRNGTFELGPVCEQSLDCRSNGVGTVDPSGQRFYWTALTLDAGWELWRTDGTRAGTSRISELDGGGPIEPPRVLETADGVLFTAADALHGPSLWHTSGEPASTRLVSDGRSRAGSSFPTSFVPVWSAAGGEGVVFVASDLLGLRLWRVPGDSLDAQPVEGVPPIGSECSGSPQHRLVSSGGLAWVVQQDELSMGLLRTDGTPEGTFCVVQTAPYDLDTQITPLGDAVLFYARMPASQAWSLWRSDGSLEGTERLLELEPFYTPPLLIPFSESTMLMVDRARPDQMYITDGTIAGTRPTGDFTGLPLPDPARSVRIGDTAFFSIDGFGFGGEVWRTRGTPESTEQAIDHAAGGLGLSWTELAVHRGDLFALRRLRDGKLELLVLRGGTGQPIPIAAIQGARLYPPRPMRSHDRYLYFVADDLDGGAELWRTDGTASGTRRVKDVNPGETGSNPSSLTSGGDRLVFTATDGRSGTELWTTDGSEAGTGLTIDLAPGAQSSDPEELSWVGGRLLFSADDGLVGREPWVASIGGTAICVPSSTVLCLSGSRFRVEVAWRDFAGLRGTGSAIPLTDDTGVFWFFGDANLELMVKVLDARGVNDRFWVFYGALSNVEYSITVTDTHTGRARRYFNPLGDFASVGDTSAFASSSSPPADRLASVETVESVAPVASTSAMATVIRSRRAASGPCGGSDSLCLGGRFDVAVEWRDFAGGAGKGRPRALTSDTGAFWFFDDANQELLVKVLDARAVNGRFWVFFGALSNVEYTIRVTDTATGDVRSYRNELGSFGSVGDTQAF